MRFLLDSETFSRDLCGCNSWGDPDRALDSESNPQGDLVTLGGIFFRTCGMGL